MPNPIKKKLAAAVKKASEVRQAKLENKAAVAKKAGDYQKSTKLQNKATKIELKQFGRDIKNMKPKADLSRVPSTSPKFESSYSDKKLHQLKNV